MTDRQGTVEPEAAARPGITPDGDGLDRWEWVWEGLLAVTLAVPTVLAVSRAETPGDRLAITALAAALALWHWLAAIRRPEWEGRAPMAVWLAGMLALVWALLGLDGSYLMLVYGLYPQVFGRLGRGAIPAAVALTVLVFWRTGALGDGTGGLLAVGGSTLLAVMIGVFINAIARQSAARQEALEALEATRAELAAASRRAGISEERERLAREIHDTVAQGFTGIVMQLEAAEQALDADVDADVDAARDHLVRARRSARDSLGELRRAVRALRPELLDGATLSEAVERAVRRWSEETGVPATVSATGHPPSARPEAEVALLRIVQEALANVARHAGARRVSVWLGADGDELVLRVADDGSGFDPAAGRGTGMGLRGMRERAEALGGRLSVRSAPGAGTRVEARVPADAPGQPATEQAGGRAEGRRPAANHRPAALRGEGP